MRISRKKRPDKPLIPRYYKNEYIRVPEVRVLGIEGENLGVMKTTDAVKLAKNQEFDLVEINPKAEPPVAKIMNFSQFKYQKEKEVRKQKINSHVSELKGIRLSISIGEGDLKVRQNQAEKFLNRGDKVKTEIILRGRERSKTPMAYEVIRNFTKNIEITMPLRVEQETTRQGNKITTIIVKK